MPFDYYTGLKQLVFNFYRETAYANLRNYFHEGPSVFDDCDTLVELVVSRNEFISFCQFDTRR
jgi:hypothetical protein